MTNWNDYKNHVRQTNPEIGKDIDEIEERAKIVSAMIDQRHIEVSVDPFYSDSNIRYLENIVRDIKDGKAHFAEHDLIEAD